MSRWRVWLADGTTFDSEQGDPADVPKYPRVLCIAQDGEAAELWGPCLTNGDAYLYRVDLGAWTEHTDQAVRDEFIDHADQISVCRAGKYTDKPTFKAAWAQAREWAGMER
jgi:hypothetical protein